MEPSQNHLVVAMATILLSAITKLCILCHISWTKHDNPYVLMVKEYNDTTYNNINCSGEELMVKSVIWEANHSIWVSKYHSINSPYYGYTFFYFFDN